MKANLEKDFIKPDIIVVFGEKIKMQNSETFKECLNFSLKSFFMILVSKDAQGPNKQISRRFFDFFYKIKKISLINCQKTHLFSTF